MEGRAKPSDTEGKLPTIYGMKSRAPLPLVLGLLMALASPGLPASAQEAFPPFGGDSGAADFPETWEARRAVMDGLILAQTSRALAWKDKVYVGGGEDARIRLVAQKENFYVLLENKRGGKYVTYSQGSWVIKRSRKTGEFVQAKVFLKSDQAVFARIFPFNDRSKMEIILYGAVVYRDVILPLPFEDVLGQPFSRIMEYSSSWIDWGFLSPNPGLYAEQAAMVAAIRAGLKRLEFRDDGALDRSGRPVLIADGSPQIGSPGLNCSGFSKWVVDGLYAPLIRKRSPAGEDPGPLLMPIDELKVRYPELRGSSISEPYEDLRDPYFGIDWVRNLGRLYSDALDPRRKAGPADRDVSVHPFSQTTGVGELLNTRLPYDAYPDFTANVGYLVSGLKPLFYKLAIQDPASFYLGAFSTDKGSRNPPLTQYYHIAVFFPYFGADGIFRVAVFESCAETSLEAVVKRVPDNYLFLVRLPADSRADYDAASGVLAGGE